VIENLKDLKALLKLCRQNGVTEINWGTGSLKLGGDGPLPLLNPEVEEMEDAEARFMEIAEAPLTHEEAVAFAAGA